MIHDLVLIVDFGSPVTQLIARRVREAGVYCEIHPFSKAGEAFAGSAEGGDPFRRAGVGPEPGSPRRRRRSCARGSRLGICYGQQTLCAQLGGKVEGGHAREFGRAEVEPRPVRVVRRRLANWRPLSGVDEPRRPHDPSA